MIKKYLFLSLFSILFFYPVFTGAVFLGQEVDFYVDPSYEIKSRDKIKSVLILETNSLYFYIDNSVWKLYSDKEKNDTISNLEKLSEEFEKKIYPTLTSNYGKEWNPGIDNDSKVTVLFHQLKRGAGGYFNSGNQYSKFEYPRSNEREMVYINSDYADNNTVFQLLAHELTHLITFNQKNRTQNIEEEVWLNEARAEYAITLCGYDDNYSGSNLQKRVVEFLKNPNDAIIDWRGFSSDYGALNVFIQYLVDHYGVEILNDSLHSDKIGIDSIDYALEKNGYSESFSDIFSDWVIAVLLNDCSLGLKYCYNNSNLKNLKILPMANILSFDSNSNVSISYFLKSWSGHWYKINEGSGDISIGFKAKNSGLFEVRYLLCDAYQECKMAPLILADKNSGNISINDFGQNYTSLVLVFFAKNKTNNSYQFFLDLEFNSGSQEKQNSEIAKLMAQIEELKRKIEQIKILLAQAKKTSNCSIASNLYYGMVKNNEVICLQQLLKNQGEDVYPEGLVTGNFLSLTREAVIRFQEKHREEVLAPLGLIRGTGFVGFMTREKIKELSY